jgi:7,8-dihydro-6-hydroxymethylpterin-pyrophosphokinase
MAARRFVLAPLAEVAPYATVPATGYTVAELLAACTDEAEVARLHPAWP